MGYHRAAFAAGVAVGFIVGSRAGRERYDQIVRYAKKAWQSPPVQRAVTAASGKAGDLSKSAVTKATDLTRSAAAQAPDAARKAAGTARDRVSRMSAPKLPVPRPGWLGNTHAHPATVTPPSVNGNSHTAHDYHD
jgi:hypothetical protein